METMLSSITKEAVQELPKAHFDGKIILIESLPQADKAVKRLLRSKVLGIDTETRPSFEKNKQHKVALLQLSNSSTCYLFRLNKIGLPDSLRKLLETNKVCKVGLSLHDDFRALKKRRLCYPKQVVELQKEVGKVGIAELGLQKIYAILFGERISKSARLTNWEAESLSQSQQEYAALDAWACLRIYKKLCRLIATPAPGPGEAKAVKQKKKTSASPKKR